MSSFITSTELKKIESKEDENMSEYPNRMNEPCPTPTERRAEIAQRAKRPRNQVARHELKRIARRADVDGDGYIEISRCEGCGAMSSTHVYPLGELSAFF